MLKDRQIEIENLFYTIATQMGERVAKSYACLGAKEYPDSFSIYFVVEYCCCVRKIRISNHTKQHKDAPYQKGLRSLTFSKETSMDNVARFIRNGIKEMQRNAVWAAFDKIKTA